jgi:hypothetical protein
MIFPLIFLIKRSGSGIRRTIWIRVMKQGLEKEQSFLLLLVLLFIFEKGKEKGTTNLNGCENRSYIVCGTPSVLENVKAKLSIRIHCRRKEEKKRKKKKEK